MEIHLVLVLLQEGTHLFGNLLQAAAVADLWDFSWDISKPWTLENIQALIRHSNHTVVVSLYLYSFEKAS